MSTAHVDDTQLPGAIETALSQARQLNYPVENMDISASMKNGNYVVHFFPVCTPGAIVMGGDLEIIIDSAGHQVLDFSRGQ